MRLKATNTIRVHAPQACPAVAMLRPRSGVAQWIVSSRYDMTPWIPTVEFEDTHGNLGQRFIVPAGGMTIEVEVVMETEASIAIDMGAQPTHIDLLPAHALVYLLPSRYCASDRLGIKAQQIVQGIAPGYAQVEAIRSWIYQNLTYEYGVSNASTDAEGTLQFGKGVCRDFAHVGISLTRSLQIPARQVVGYLHGLDPMDMHAWFEAFLDGRWYIFDATQEAPRGGRIVVGYGRDAADVAFISNYGELSIEAMTVSVEAL